MAKAKIKVTRISESGVYAKGCWWNFDLHSDICRDDFEKNGTYDVTYNERGKNSKWITEATISSPGWAEEKKEQPIEKKTEKPSSDDKMTKEEWAAKDKRIKRSGLIQAAIQAAATIGVEKEKLAENAERLGKIFREELQRIKSDRVELIRGKGLLNAVVITPKNGQTAWEDTRCCPLRTDAATPRFSWPRGFPLRRS